MVKVRGGTLSLAPRSMPWSALGLLICACVTTPERAGPVTAMESALVSDARDRRLDDFDLLDAALVASGVSSPTALRSERARLEQHLGPLQSRLQAIASTEERAHALLEGLHSHVLRRYSARTTTMLELVDAGVYNCVTATLLYNAMAERLGLLTRAVLLPSHVFTVLYTGAGAVEIETTSAHGFSPDRESGSYLRFLAERGLHRGATVVGTRLAPESPEMTRAIEIDDPTLVSLIYSNRGLTASESGDADAAYRLFRVASLLAADERARELRYHVAALVNGLVVAAAEAGEYQRGLRLVDAARAEAPVAARSVLLHNRFYCVNELVQGHLAGGRHEVGLRVVNEGLAVDPRRQALHELRAAIFNRWAVVLADDGDDEAALQVIRRGLVLEPDHPVLLQNRRALLYNAALRQVNAGNCRSAVKHIERGKGLFRETDEFLELERRCASDPAAEGVDSL